MKSSSLEAQAINDRLLELYGKHISSDRPRFRVVWSDDQFEKRFGDFQVYAGDVYLRNEVGIREVPKYNWLENQWVVERLHDNYHQDVFDGVHTYEPLFSFPKNLPVSWEAIDFVVKTALKLYTVDRELPKTEKEVLYRDEEAKKKESAEIRDMIELTPLQTSLNDGSAVSLTHKNFGDLK